MRTYSLIVLFPVLFSYVFSRILNQRLAELLPVFYGFSVVWLIVFGMFDRLKLGYSIFYPVATLILVLFAVIHRKKLFNRLSLGNFLSPAVFMFLLVTAWMYTNSLKMRFFEWDEFAFWAPAVKVMFIFDKVGIFTPDSLAVPEYVPGAPLFPYLVSKVNGIWIEGNVYWAYQVLIVAAMAAVFSRVTWKNFLKLPLLLLILALSFVFFFNSFQTIYVDPLLASLFGLLLILVLSNSVVKNKFYLFNFVILCTHISLVKDIGIFFAALATGILMINYLISSLHDKNEIPTGIFKTIAIGLVALTPAVVIKQYWTTLLTQNGLLVKRDFSTILNDFLSGSSNIDENFRSQVQSNFLNYFSNYSISNINGLPMTSLRWIFVMGFLLIILSLFEKNKTRVINQLILNFLLILGFFAYLAILLYLYLTVFAPVEAIGLASYSRYVSAYLAGMFVYLAYRFFLLFEEKHLNFFGKAFAVSFSILIVTQSSPANLISYGVNPNFNSDNWRNNYSAQEYLISEMNLPKDKKVWLIAQHTTGYEFYMFQYFLAPASVGKIPWSIGAPSGEGDIWTDKTYTKEKWSERLKEYDYVFINNVNENFISEFGPLFKDPSTLDKPGFYLIDKSTLGEPVTLEKIR